MLASVRSRAGSVLLAATLGAACGRGEESDDDLGLSGLLSAGTASACPTAPYDLDEQNRTAVDLVNTMRGAIGVACLEHHGAIEIATARHCRYYAENAAAGATACIARPHDEVPGCKDFVAARFGDRMRAAGYDGGPAYEVMAYEADSHTAVTRWIHSVWHRIPLLHPRVRDTSYGHGTACDTMDFGYGAVAAQMKTTVYPVPGQTGVPSQFDGAEAPAPPAPPQGWPSGYPIIVYADKLTVKSHVIEVDGSGQPLDHTWLSPGDPRARGLLLVEYLMYTDRPLSARTRYHVRIEAGVDHGDPVVLDWTFTTR